MSNPQKNNLSEFEKMCLPPDDLTLEDFIAQKREEIAKIGREKKTFQFYQINGKKFLEPNPDVVAAWEKRKLKK